MATDEEPLGDESPWDGLAAEAEPLSALPIMPTAHTAAEVDAPPLGAVPLEPTAYVVAEAGTAPLEAVPLVPTGYVAAEIDAAPLAAAVAGVSLAPAIGSALLACPHCGADQPRDAGVWCAACGLRSTGPGSIAPAHPAASAVSARDVDETQRCRACGVAVRAERDRCDACGVRVGSDEDS